MALMSDLQLDRLSLLDRVTLVQELWDSIAESQAAVPLTDSQRNELARRVANADDHPDDVISWEEIRTEAIERLNP